MEERDGGSRWRKREGGSKRVKDEMEKKGREVGRKSGRRGRKRKWKENERNGRRDGGRRCRKRWNTLIENEEEVEEGEEGEGEKTFEGKYGGKRTGLQE